MENVMSLELDDPMLLKAKREVAKIYKANEISYLAGTLATLRATGLYKG
jgi:hypothetical protein